jgi:hypothetical protein
MSLLPLTIPVPTPLIRTIPLLRPSAPGSAIAQSDGEPGQSRATNAPDLDASFDSRSHGVWIRRWRPRDFEMQLRGTVALLAKVKLVASLRRGRRGCCCLLDASEGSGDRVNCAAWQSRAELAANHLISCHASLRIKVQNRDGLASIASILDLEKCDGISGSHDEKLA